MADRGGFVTEQPSLSFAPVHRTDGAESRQAAARVDAAGQYRKVLEALYHAPGPLTDDELAETLGLLRHAAGTRRGVAVREGLVVRAGTGMTPRGNRCASWTLSPSGVEHVARLLEAAA
jgi:hypothetical protein